MWKRGTINRDAMIYKRSPRGRLMVCKSRIKKGQWRWDATQEQPNMVVPDGYHMSGLAATQRAAKEAAEHALRHMLTVNA